MSEANNREIMVESALLKDTEPLIRKKSNMAELKPPIQGNAIPLM